MPTFGPLIGIIHINNTHCRFLVYSTKNAEVLTFHEQELRQLVPRAGCLEYDPDEIWKLTQACIETAYKNLVILDIGPADLIAVGVCTQRGTSVAWDRQTGNALHNAIGWTDVRAVALLQTLLHNVKHDVNYLRPRSGLPLSTCFAALKLKWLAENVPAVAEAMVKGNCAFGTLDSWLLWNLTGGAACGVHATDVTNASYTSLMNVHTQQWDAKLCGFFRLPPDLLPRIRSNSEVYGYVHGGPLNGLPIAGCIGDQPAALLGQLTTEVGQHVCSIDDSCRMLLNTGPELIDSTTGLLSSVAYKLGATADTCYSLEGAIANAGATVSWLQRRLHLNTEVNANDNVVEVLNTFFSESSMLSSSCSSNILNAECGGGLATRRSEITFVPAFHGLYSPYWRYDARGIILGLTSQTTGEHVTQAAYEATGFQIHEILEAFRRDTRTLGTSSVRDNLIVGGEFAENASFVQFVADIVGCKLLRPQTTSPAGLGAMIATGITMDAVSLDHAKLMYVPPSDVFTPTTAPNRREQLYKRWAYAVRKCLEWNNYESYEADLALFAQRECDSNFPIRRSIPGSVFLTSTFALLLIARFLLHRMS